MLRLRFPGAALLLTLAAANPLLAQTPAPAPAAPPPAAPAPTTASAIAPSHLQAARALVVASGISGSFEGIYPEFRLRMRQSIGVTRPEIAKDLEASIDLLKPEADKRIDDMITAAARIFAAKLPEADLQEATAFFSSPVGKRFNQARAGAIDEIFNVLQPWSIQTTEALFNAVRAEMKKKGHNI